MITIDRMEIDYRLGGRPDARAHLARRLDRIVAERIGGALEAALGEAGRDDGPVVLIRRLDLRLWIDATRTSDGDIARAWSSTLAEAFFRRLAEAGPADVRRYHHQGAYLAAWLADHVSGRTDGRWEYAALRTLDDVPTGRAAALVLGRDRRWIAPAWVALADAHRLDAVVDAFHAADVAVRPPPRHASIRASCGGWRLGSRLLPRPRVPTGGLGPRCAPSSRSPPARTLCRRR